jgi:hypothetical protein
MSEIDFIAEVPFNSTESLREIAKKITRNYVMLYIKPYPLDLGMFAVERFVAVAEDTGADMVYSDHYELVKDVDGTEVRKKHPLIECQKGALRNDFDFGSVLFFRTDSFKAAVNAMDRDWKWGALYDLRLRMNKIVHINEYLYTEVETDLRKSGEKQFDYVDPRNREVQVEMEQICTEHLKRVGAYLEPVFKEPYILSSAQKDGNLHECKITQEGNGYPVVATVVIPVFNRISTVRDAVESALSQQCDFPFNVIVVDNHSTDGTTELLEEIAAKDARLVHIVPAKYDLGIGGCWNLAIHSESCGEYAVQLDSDDVYSGPDTLTKIVNAFREQDCAMVSEPIR